MKIPRDISGPELVKALRTLGYTVDGRAARISVSPPSRTGRTMRWFLITTRSKRAPFRVSSNGSLATTV